MHKRGQMLAEDVVELLQTIARQNRQILRALKGSKRREIEMARTLDEALAAVERNTTVEEGLYTYISSLHEQMKNAGLSPTDQAKVDRIFEAAEAQNAKAAAALMAHTPAAGTESTAGQQG
jgi:hypothetical protein